MGTGGSNHFDLGRTFRYHCPHEAALDAGGKGIEVTAGSPSWHP